MPAEQMIKEEIEEIDMTVPDKWTVIDSITKKSITVDGNTDEDIKKGIKEFKKTLGYSGVQILSVDEQKKTYVIRTIDKAGGFPDLIIKGDEY